MDILMVHPKGKMNMSKWLQSSKHITFRVDGAVAYITLNRPEVRNALSWELLNEYRGALLEADDLTDVGVVVAAVSVQAMT